MGVCRSHIVSMATMSCVLFLLYCAFSSSGRDCDVTQNVTSAGGEIMRHRCVWLEDDNVKHGRYPCKCIMATTFLSSLFLYYCL